MNALKIGLGLETNCSIFLRDRLLVQMGIPSGVTSFYLLSDDWHAQPLLFPCSIFDLASRGVRCIAVQA